MFAQVVRSTGKREVGELGWSCLNVVLVRGSGEGGCFGESGRFGLGRVFWNGAAGSWGTGKQVSRREET
ncbi:MAG: hypothetical protein ACTS7I_02035 [Candidatus Hodgkinia cicadicola]